MNPSSLSEQELLRHEKKTQLEHIHIDPYPATSFFATTHAAELHECYAKNPDKFKNVKFTGV